MAHERTACVPSLFVKEKKQKFFFVANEWDLQSKQTVHILEYIQNIKPDGVRKVLKLTSLLAYWGTQELLMRKAQSCQKIIKKRTFQNDGKTKETFWIFMMEEIWKKMFPMTFLALLWLLRLEIKKIIKKDIKIDAKEWERIRNKEGRREKYEFYYYLENNEDLRRCVEESCQSWKTDIFFSKPNTTNMAHVKKET